MAVENKGAKWLVRIACRGRNALHNRFENLRDTDARLCTRWDCIRGIDCQHRLDLLGDALRVRGGQVNLVDDRDNRKVRIHREVGIRKRLRFDALRCIHNQQCAFTGIQ